MGRETKMSRISAGIIVLAVLAAVGCSPKMEISTTYKPADIQAISEYKTYSWLPLPKAGDSRINNEFVAEHVVPEVDRILAEKGLRRDTTGTAEFKVGYIVTMQDITDVKSVNTYYGYEYGYEGASGPGYTATYDVSYEKGSLIIDMVDIKSEQLIWRGTAQGKADPDSDPSKRQQRLEEAVQKILKEFPPKPE
jgi:hypothetical protein